MSTFASEPELRCQRCGRRASPAETGLGCSVCLTQGFAVNLTTIYDLERAREAFAEHELASRPQNMWRYAELLPVRATDRISLGEGGTPLVELPRLGDHLGLGRLWLKDESRNPTWSFKDRAVSVAASLACARGMTGLVVASTGNAAAATAAYARRAGIPAVIFFARNVNPLMAAFVRAYGATTMVAPTKPERWRLMRHLVAKRGFYPTSGYSDPPIGNFPWVVDGYKTVGFEIWEQLGRRAPDWICLPVGHGDCLYGIHKAFGELSQLGLSERPRLGAGEIYGSLTAAVASGDEQPRRMKITHETIAFSMGTAQSTFQAFDAIRRSHGFCEQVADQKVLDAQRLLLETEGVFVETAAAAGLAAMIARIDCGLLGDSDEVVLIATSAGFKAIGMIPPVAKEHEVASVADVENTLEEVGVSS